jgi:hypothetical protein
MLSLYEVVCLFTGVLGVLSHAIELIGTGKGAA